MRADSSFHSHLMRVRNWCMGRVTRLCGELWRWERGARSRASAAWLLLACPIVIAAPPALPFGHPPPTITAQVPEDLLSTEFKKGLGQPADGGDAFDAAVEEAGSEPRPVAGGPVPGGQAWSSGRVGFTPEHLRELLKRRDITFTKSAFE